MKFGENGNYRIVITGESRPGEKWPGINGGLTPRREMLLQTASPLMHTSVPSV